MAYLVYLNKGVSWWIQIKVFYLDMKIEILEIFSQTKRGMPDTVLPVRARRQVKYTGEAFWLFLLMLVGGRWGHT